LESGWEAQMSGGFGLTPSESFASFDPVSVSLKTRQLSLALMMDWPNAGMMCCGESFPLLPWVLDTSESECASLLPTPLCSDVNKRGMQPDRKVDSLPYRVKGELLPTPSTRQPISDADMKRNTPNLACHTLARLLPTPTTRDYKDTPGMKTEAEDGRKRLDQLPRVIFAAESPAPIGGMKLTPEFQCWLMGYLPDWLRPLRDALETASSRKSSSRSSKPSEAK